VHRHDAIYITETGALRRDYTRRVNIRIMCACVCVWWWWQRRFVGSTTGYTRVKKPWPTDGNTGTGQRRSTVGRQKPLRMLTHACACARCCTHYTERAECAARVYLYACVRETMTTVAVYFVTLHRCGCIPTAASEKEGRRQWHTQQPCYW